MARFTYVLHCEILYFVYSHTKFPVYVLLNKTGLHVFWIL